jgi:UDP-N-acetylglucosamine--N-acetylmuramyl-(pentapeptide) pyrophosphoryl-undecaprenol N-acetylglucosamine transferase
MSTPSARRGRRVLACASSGGHFKQLVGLIGRLPDVGEVTWLTYDSGLPRDLLAAAGHGDDPLVLAPYAAPRDIPNLVRDARVADVLLRTHRYDLAVSTGAGLAVATLPLARARGVRAVFVESATRSDGPSMSGRLLARVPGIELCAQHPGFGPRWRHVGSVHDGFAPGPERPDRSVRRVVVTLGTIAGYGFARLVRRLLEVLPGDVEVLWQTGATDVRGLGIQGAPRIPAPRMAAAMREADVVVAHAGTGSALSAFEAGVRPVLVPRRRAFGEHVDDHQVVTAAELARRGLALHVEADALTLDDLVRGAAGSVVRDHTPERLPL